MGTGNILFLTIFRRFLVCLQKWPMNSTNSVVQFFHSFEDVSGIPLMPMEGKYVLYTDLHTADGMCTFCRGFIWQRKRPLTERCLFVVHFETTSMARWQRVYSRSAHRSTQWGSSKKKWILKQAKDTIYIAFNIEYESLGRRYVWLLTWHRLDTTGLPDLNTLKKGTQIH